MIDDFIAPSQSAKQIEAKALAWRDALDVPNDWAPDVVRIVEIRLSKIFPAFTLIVRPDTDMGDAEAYTEFNPPLIAVRESVYRLARRHDGRARMTFAHELGHLVMHPGATKLRIESGNKTASNIKIYESAEWQARKFAAFFLLPRHIVVQFASARELSENCNVSFQAAEIRFQEVGHIQARPAACVEQLANALAIRLDQNPTTK